MQMPRIVSSTLDVVATTYDAITRFAKLERVLAFVCLMTPLLLIWSDDGPIRSSISAYYNMKENQLFYFPLTMLAMLFVVNGVVKEKKVYNTLLGTALAGVTLLNHIDFKTLHDVFAAAFFGGNAIVIVVFSSKKERWFKMLLVTGIALAMIACFVLGWLSLFWAEWLSFGIIALHYILESSGHID